jgi:hypothetical protein
MSVRSRHVLSARNRINDTNAQLVSSRKRWQTASIDTDCFESSPGANSVTVKVATSEGLVGNGVRSMFGLRYWSRRRLGCANEGVLDVPWTLTQKGFGEGWAKMVAEGSEKQEWQLYQIGDHGASRLMFKRRLRERIKVERSSRDVTRGLVSSRRRTSAASGTR